MTDAHKITQRMKTRRENNDYDIVEELDQHLTLILDSPDGQHHYRHLGNLITIKDFQPERDLSDLTEEQVNKILTEIEQSRYSTRVDHYKQSTKNKYRKTVDYLLQMQDKDWDDYTPKGVDVYQETSDQEFTSKDDLMTPRELNKFLSTMAGLTGKGLKLRNEAFFYTLWNTGARAGGVLQMDVEHVSINGQVVEATVPAHKDSPKREDLPLRFAAPVLKRYVSTLPNSQEALFKSRHGGRMSYSSVRNKAVETWEKLEDKDVVDVKWEGQPLHIFRKSWKTYSQIMKLLGPDEADKWSGHAIGNTQVKRIYDRRDTESAARQMRESLGLQQKDRIDWKKYIVPQECTDCGQTNSSHNEICFSCGGTLKEGELPSKIKHKKQEAQIDKSVELAMAIQENPDKSLNELKKEVFEE